MQERKRLLYVGFNRSYVNRTFAVLIRAIQADHDLDFYGPGFQKMQTLEHGIDRWIEKQGQYDLVLFDHYTIMQDEISKRKNPFMGDVIYFAVED
ncbi:MAG TPA: hypothetical protein VM260_15660, partial [Pirellula sp.]|nr:hypothetical protein [Pirellula sp.]